MAKKVYKKVMFVGRATTFVVGLTVILALTVGLASTALAGTGVGARFQLGQTNTVNAITKLVGSAVGPSLQIDNNSTDAAATALDLQVEPGKAPMKVNSATQVANLNADKLDGKSVGDIGVNGLVRVSSASAANSYHWKEASVSCPAGKVAVGSGYDIIYGESNQGQETDVVVTELTPAYSHVYVEAMEEEPNDSNWMVLAKAVCATAP
jgi:hypothetical protein